MKNKVVLIIALISFSILGSKQASGAGDSYNLAEDAVRSGYKDFAFVYFLSELRENPASDKRPEALFACAEYYFLVKDYNDAFSALKEFIIDYPDSQLQAFALLYLFRISEAQGQNDLAKNIEQQIKNLKRVILLFKTTKEYKFKSPLGINHKLIYYIDKLEFYSDDQLQARFYY